jgi:hypothetical protein
MDGRRIVRWTRGRDSDVVSEAADLLLRIDRLCSRAPSARPGDTLLGEMEALLADGYAEALAKEAASRRLARRLARRVELVDQPDAAIEIRTLALEKRGLDTEIAVLRDRLRVMRERFAHLRAQSTWG